MTLPAGARVAIVLLCLCAVMFFLRVLAAVVREAWIVRRAGMREEATATRLPALRAHPRREKLVVIGAETLQRRFGARNATRRF